MRFVARAVRHRGSAGTPSSRIPWQTSEYSTTVAGSLRRCPQSPPGSQAVCSSRRP
ncbi:hypothetical protein PYCCODRAFT_1095434 [Trametes coccinea BRFM310]|uniref:Uncharacterized protein n=1 Tax=Trametes coccinea (strain BRFM310) TaxID=1353009 RepID=A0A1Y2IAV5_TRAC3|nr:hypothetical protein PYCCODRAFT_1095434 [Trametes coccinea BRFM310]